jgi:uncharacterized protein
LTSTVDLVHEAPERSSWNALASGLSFYATWQHAAFSQAFHRGDTAYLTCTGPRGLVGVLPVFSWCGTGPASYDYRAQYSAVIGENHCRYPGVLAGTCGGYLTDLVISQTLPFEEQIRVVRLLLDGLRELVRSSPRVHSGALMYLPPRVTTLIRGALAGAGWPDLLVSGLEADAYLALPFTDFDGYLSSLSAGRRGAIRREIAAFRRRGLSVSTVPLASCAERVPTLMANVERKYGRPAEISVLSEIVAGYIEHIESESRVFACFAEGDLVAFSLFFEWEGNLYARSFGIDYDHHESNSFTYFNVLFYEPIKYALERGLDGVHLGPSTPAKAARGARIRPLWSLVVGPESDYHLGGEMIAAWNRRQLAAWRDAYRDFDS